MIAPKQVTEMTQETFFGENCSHATQVIVKTFLSGSTV